MSTLRTITVFTTKGKQKAKIETDVTTWGELKPLVQAQGYDLGSLHATENINRADLVNLQAVLPNQDFVLFLRPKKTKSGLDVEGLGFKALRAVVKDHGEHVKEYLNNYSDKNWTQLTTAELSEALSEYQPCGGDLTAQEEVAEEIEVDAVDNIANVDVISKILDVILETSDSEEVEERVEAVKEELIGLRGAIEEESNPEAVAKRREEEAARLAEQEENDRLAQEATGLCEDFDC